MSWLWKSDTSSPASFEKALSKLSGQIATANLAFENTRSRGRRVKALWTLYTTLTYVLSLLILVLVIGPQNWAVPHYGGILGAPIIIYLVRFAVTTVFDWDSSRKQAHLQHLQKQRDTKINDLKKATRYDSTQELLQKYGGTVPKESSPAQSPSTPSTKHSGKQQQARTGLPPPPTANIQPRSLAPSPDLTRSTPKAPSTPQQQPNPFPPDEPGFAPNAFTSQAPRAVLDSTPHWYDRILDVLLGEDETQAKNRLVLLCQNCRLVNGQAPPGIQTLEELGKWRCASCGAWNGHESEAVNIVKGITARTKPAEDESQAQEHKTLELQEDSGVGTAMENESGSEVAKRVTRSTGTKPGEGL